MLYFAAGVSYQIEDNAGNIKRTVCGMIGKQLYGEETSSCKVETREDYVIIMLTPDEIIIIVLIGGADCQSWILIEYSISLDTEFVC